MSQAQWREVLAVAHRFEISEIYDRALHELQKPHSFSDAIKLVGLAERFDVSPSKLVLAFDVIITRPEYLTEEECRQVGFKYLACIAEARERKQEHSSTNTG
jgi:hypothetical protein